MASPNGYGTAVRDALTSKGIKNSDIGYNSNNGYITVGGSDFMKPSKVLNGVSYDTAQNFNNAWSNYQNTQSKKAAAPSASTGYTPSYAPAGMVGVRDQLQTSGYNPSSIGYSNGMATVNNQPFTAPTVNLGGTLYTTPSGYNQGLSNYRINDLQNQVYNGSALPTNPYTSQLDQQIAALQQLAQSQQTTDPYSTPQYAAYQAQSDRRANEGIRAQQEALGGSGFGRSTMLSDRAGGIQNQEREYLETQVIPQIIAAEQARQQQQYNNLLSLLTPLQNQQAYADNRYQTELTNKYNALNALATEQQRGMDNTRADAALTGNYLTPQQQALIDNLYALKSQAEAQGITKAQRAALSTQADGIRNQLQASGLDISKLGANTSLAQAKQSGVGRTLAGQDQDFNQQLALRKQDTADKQYSEQFAYQKARDAIADKQWQTKFDEDVRQNGLSYGLQQLAQQNDQAYRQAQLALSQDDNARQWAALDYDQSQGTGAKNSGFTPSQVLDNVKSLYSEPVYSGTEFDENGNEVPKDTGKRKITTDPAKRKEMFEAVIDYGLSDAETNQILLSLGMSKKEIDSLLKQYPN